MNHNLIMISIYLREFWVIKMIMEIKRLVYCCRQPAGESLDQNPKSEPSSKDLSSQIYPGYHTHSNDHLGLSRLHGHFYPVAHRKA